MATTLNVTFEGQAVGANLTAANTGLSEVTPTGTATATYDSANVAAGTRSAKLACTTGNTITLRRDIGSLVGTRYVRWYFTPETVSTASVVLAEVRTGTTPRAQVQWTNGKIRIRNGTTTTATSTTSFPAGQMVRLEWELINGTRQALRIFTGNNVHGTTPDETITGTFNTGTFDVLWVGVLQAVAWTVWVDELKVDDATWPGTAGTPPAASVAWEEDFNDRTAGQALTDANSPFTVTGTAAATYVSDATALEGVAVKVSSADTTQTKQLRRALGATATSYFFRVYFRTPRPATLNVAHYFLQAVSGSTIRAQAGIGADATLRVRNGTTAVGSTSKSLPPDTMCRVEWHLDGATSTQTLRMFFGANVHGATPDDTATGAFDTGSFDAVTLGILNGTEPWEATFDNLAGNSAAWVGPASVVIPPAAVKAGWGTRLFIRDLGTPPPPPPPPPPSGMLVGAITGARNGNELGVPSVNTTRLQEFTRVEGLIGTKLSIRRTFNGGFPATFANHDGYADYTRGRSMSISMKSNIADMAAGRSDALVQGFVRSIPTDLAAKGLRLYMTWQHEAENPSKGNDPATLRAGGRRFAQVVKATRVPGQNISIAWTLMGWTFSPASGRDPLDWYWGDDAVEVVAPDPYNMNQSKYVPLSATNVGGGPAHAFARAHGKRFGINEWGCLDHAPTDRPRFIREGDTWLRGLTNPVCEFATWYHDYDQAEDGIGHWIDTLHSGQASITAFSEHAKDTVA